MRTSGRRTKKIRNEPGRVPVTSYCMGGLPGKGRKGEAMLIKDDKGRGGAIPSSQITPKEAFYSRRGSRREFLTGAAALGLGAVALKQVPGLWHPAAVHADTKLNVTPSKYTVPDAQTPFSKATTYNNFYEFGTDKGDPAHNAHTL